MAGMAIIGCSALTLALFSLSGVPGPMPTAVAQTAPARQFSVAIKGRKVDTASSVIRVTQGDAVEIVLTSDEAAELHLHGYDLLLTVEPNVPATMHFAAKIAGRFPLEAHRFGPASSSPHQHAAGPLLYVEVQPR
jgi:FtsP/CotA-like multicopper oxidase with cupredoxin domain